MTDTNNNNKPRRSLILLVIAFLLPVILAKLALDNDFFNRGATNKGTLLDPILTLTPVSGEDPGKWQVMYVLPEQCDEACDNALYSIRQVWTALGKHMDRAEPLVLATEQSDQAKLNEIRQEPAIKLLITKQEMVNQVFKDVSTDGIFLVDTLHNIILSYPLQQEQQQAVLASRDILADLRKLLKLSRIG